MSFYDGRVPFLYLTGYIRGEKKKEKKKQTTLGEGKEKGGGGIEENL